MAAKVKKAEQRILDRLSEIKARAAELNMESSEANTGADLAEEAVGLALQLYEEAKS